MSDDVMAWLLSMAQDQFTLMPGQTLFSVGDTVRTMYAVQDGVVRLVRYRINGDSVVLQRARAGQLLAEASLFAPRYHCDAVAEHAARVARIDKASVLRALHEDSRRAIELAAHLAGEVQRARARAELLSRRTVDERLRAWQALHGELPSRGRWIEVAQEIGVTPEALYRALSRSRLPDGEARVPSGGIDSAVRRSGSAGAKDAVRATSSPRQGRPIRPRKA